MTYVGSAVVPTKFLLTGNDLGVMGVFFPENCDEVDVEIADNLEFRILGLY